MKKLTTLFLLAAVVSVSCNSRLSGLFEKKTPHETYAEKLDDDDLDKTPEGRLWMAASEAALDHAVTVKLPYRQAGRFPADKPRALGLKFTARQGEKLNFSVQKDRNSILPLYVDIFREENGEAVHLQAADTASTQFSYIVDKSGSYILRLQPELFRSGQYSLSISIGPSIEFPVTGQKARIGSFWGDNRDGGKRSHEGIDIFAPKRTPVIATVDGVVTGVRNGGIGGKTVWLRHLGLSYTFYYAHLDKQLVQEGQIVKKGDILGLVGNTGNARNTPSHLHFGVYTQDGPIDPLPFVNREIKTGSPVPEKKLDQSLRLVKTIKTPTGYSSTPANTILFPVGVHASGYIAELPDGKLISVPFTSVQAHHSAPVKKNRVIANKTGSAGVNKAG
jgi:murein DD-endopeptidase MepM/ murein hydrolase activator NlpD